MLLETRIELDSSQPCSKNYSRSARVSHADLFFGRPEMPALRLVGIGDHFEIDRKIHLPGNTFSIGESRSELRAFQGLQADFTQMAVRKRFRGGPLAGEIALASDPSHCHTT